MRKNILLLSVAALLISSTGALATLTLIHDSKEVYYANGTDVSDVMPGHAGNFTLGDITGPALWQVTEVAYWDEAANQTIITYTVYNHAVPSPITSLHINSLRDPISISNGPDATWTGTIEDDEYYWETNTASSGIGSTQSKNTMTVVFDGLLNITFVPVAYDLADGSIVTNSNWVVSTVAPAPAGMALCAIGLGLIGWLKRRFA